MYLCIGLENTEKIINYILTKINKHLLLYFIFILLV